MKIGERITELRKIKKISQQQLADKIGMNQSVLNRIENGSRPVRDDEIKAIASFFKVSTDYLLDVPKIVGVLYNADSKIIDIAEKIQFTEGLNKLFRAAIGANAKNVQIAANLLEQLNDDKKA